MGRASRADDGVSASCAVSARRHQRCDRGSERRGLVVAMSSVCIRRSIARWKVPSPRPDVIRLHQGTPIAGHNGGRSPERRADLRLEGGPTGWPLKPLLRVQLLHPQHTTRRIVAGEPPNRSETGTGSKRPGRLGSRRFRGRDSCPGCTNPNRFAPARLVVCSGCNSCTGRKGAVRPAVPAIVFG